MSKTTTFSAEITSELRGKDPNVRSVVRALDLKRRGLKELVRAAAVSHNRKNPPTKPRHSKTS
jgi:hypothetical protein